MQVVTHVQLFAKQVTDTCGDDYLPQLVLP